MKHYKHYVGIDISKSTLDIAIVLEGTQLSHHKINNEPKKIQKFFKLIEKELGLQIDKAVFCMEYTGIYNNHIISVLNSKKASIWLEPAIQIKKSLGMTRGKNDKVDAQRIALYAYKNRGEPNLWKPTRKIINDLKQLISIRKRLKKMSTNLKKPLSDISFLSSEHRKILKQTCRTSLAALKKDIDQIDLRIDKLLKSDKRLIDLFGLITSVKGIGKVSAYHIIVATNEFLSISEPRKFACYAGVAPFEHSSGSSLKGRTRVSDMADKSLKCVLHMAALSAIREPGELQDYFLRKVEEGKNKMSVINAVRNKLIHRVFACVRNNRRYTPILN